MGSSNKRLQPVTHLEQTAVPSEWFPEELRSWKRVLSLFYDIFRDPGGQTLQRRATRIIHQRMELQSRRRWIKRFKKSLGI